MEKTLEQLLNAYKTNIKSNLRPHALSVLEKGTCGISSFIFYGLDQILIDVYIDYLVCSIHNIPYTQITKQSNDIHKFSDYHFEFDISADERNDYRNSTYYSH